MRTFLKNSICLVGRHLILRQMLEFLQHPLRPKVGLLSCPCAFLVGYSNSLISSNYLLNVITGVTFRKTAGLLNLRIIKHCFPRNLFRRMVKGSADATDEPSGCEIKFHSRALIASQMIFICLILQRQYLRYVFIYFSVFT